MNEKGTSWIFKKLQDSDNTYKINYIDDDNIMYDPSEKTIFWNPNAFMRNTNGTIVFPATILAHEGGHALQDEKYNNKEWKILVNTFDAEYDDLLEKEVITNIEQYVAKRHGDIEEGQTTRKDHKGIIHIMPEFMFEEDFKGCYSIPEEYREEILEYLYSVWIIK